MAWVFSVVGTYLHTRDRRKASKSIRGQRAEDDASLVELVDMRDGQGGGCACRGKVLNLYKGLRQKRPT
jgi:hypothetical protein